MEKIREEQLALLEKISGYTKEKARELVMKKVEDFSDDDEIIGAYDSEWHKYQVEEMVKLAMEEEHQEKLEKAIKTIYFLMAFIMTK